MPNLLDRANQLYKRLFARCLARGDRYQDAIYGTRKESLFRDIEGRVLEIGAGTGINLPYLSSSIDWTGIEPNPHLHRFIYARADALNIRVHLHMARAECLPFQDARFDAVICTLVLCSVSDPHAALREIVRVLKPGGVFLFLEHVAAPKGTLLRGAQRTIKPLWKLVADGCRPDRDTASVINRAGFREINMESFETPMPFEIIKPHIAGKGIK